MEAQIEEAVDVGMELFEQVGARMGRENMAKRLRKQVELAAYMTSQGKGVFQFEHLLNIEWLMAFCFKACGLYGRGHRNFLDIRVVENRVKLPHLPRAFDGYRILQIADLHTDLDPDLPGTVIAKLEGLTYDLCVNTGDYRNRTVECHKASMRETRRIYEHVKGPAAGVLGNHDFIEKVPDLEAMGIRLLLNESMAIEKDGEQLWLVGVDDPDFYDTHDFARALEGVPADACKVLLSHSPETYKEAAALGFDLQLSGHTHGGQICLPGGWPPITHTHAPRKYCRGAWQFENLIGYTSRGTGGGCVPLRFNCPPEMTVHVLERE